MGLRFFGLTPSDRPTIFTIVHEIVYHGNGGYSWEEVYNMPIWLRTFTLNKIVEFLEEQQRIREEAEMEAEGIEALSKENQQVTPPDFVVRASNK